MSEPTELQYAGPLGELRDAEIAVEIAAAALAGAKERLRRAKEAVAPTDSETKGEP